jgi:hypothetical protein
LLGRLVKDIVIPPGGTNTDLTMTFTASIATVKAVGTLPLTSNDPTAPTTTLTFGAEAVPVGMRVLVVDADGNPYPSVDDIKLTNPSLKVSTHLRDVPLTTIDPPASWKRIQYHYMTALLPTSGSNTYTLRVQVGNKKQTVQFMLDPDQFQQIVVTLQ